MTFFACNSLIYFRRKKNVCRAVFSFVLISFIWTIAVLSASDNPTIISKACYQQKEMVGSEINRSIEFLDDVLFSERQPQKGKTIFFHETSCSADYLVQLNARQACAIESAARWNPNSDVFLLFAAPVGFVKDSELHSPVMDALTSYPNIFMRNVHLWTYAAGTPFANWLINGKLFDSKYLVSHTSDLLRYLTMYIFGGIYMDLDVVVQKTFENIEPNFTGAESPEDIAAGVMSFAHTGIGHDVAELCVNDFIKNFMGNVWINNGPGVITRVLHQICNTKNPAEMTSDRCGGFRVYNPNVFYAVHWESWRNFFFSQSTNDILNITRDSLAIHVWNKLSKDEKVQVGSNVAYGLLAEKNCPKVYRSCDRTNSMKLTAADLCTIR